ncbi:hypothetical protein PVL29_016027 [Vitis rotundifolia]|uniref:Uncharacterized protein n=1 Tax=Vitis rotundifolia TaxID=103349 RepID=A0AA38ZEZ7_VITRO|nr:hypothetical protein PVL29_016027 [Vitis rotundifolia]
MKQWIELNWLSRYRLSNEKSIGKSLIEGRKVNCTYICMLRGVGGTGEGTGGDGSNGGGYVSQVDPGIIIINNSEQVAKFIVRVLMSPFTKGSLKMRSQAYWVELLPIGCSHLFINIFKELSVTIPIVSTNALGYGAFLGLFANLRYQLLCGVDRAMINHSDVIGVALFFSTALRILNVQLGETSRLAWLGVEADPLAQSDNFLKAYNRPSEGAAESSSKWLISKKAIVSGLGLLGIKLNRGQVILLLIRNHHLPRHEERGSSGRRSPQLLHSLPDLITMTKQFCSLLIRKCGTSLHVKS